MTAGTRFGAEASAVPARWLPAVALLAVAGVLSAIAPLFTLVTAADGSSTAPPVHSAWVAVLPALVALALVATGGTRALGAVFGAGAVAIGQALADLGLLVDPDSMLRPELFGVATIDAFPLTRTGWAGLPVIAELLAVVALAIAARDVLEPLDRDPVADDERPRVLRFTPGTLLGLALRGGRGRRRCSACCTRPRCRWSGRSGWRTSGCPERPARRSAPSCWRCSSCWLTPWTPPPVRGS